MQASKKKTLFFIILLQLMDVYMYYYAVNWVVLCLFLSYLMVKNL